MRRFFIYSLICCFAAALLSACGSSSDEPTPPTPPEPQVAHRTVLVYMLADNNLGTDHGFNDKDLDEMVEGVKTNGLNGGRLIVYHNRPYTAQGNPPQLIEITSEGPKVLNTYSDDPDLYSVEIGRMRSVLSDMKTYAPADDYGIIFWGHATSWMTEDGDMDRLPTPRSYGNDRNKWMSLSSLGKALEGEQFSFMYFDCCLMGTVEIAYEFRYLTPLIAASPTEVEGEGMPYHLNMPAFFAKESPDVIGAARNTYEYLSGKGLKSQMVVINTAGMDELAARSRDIFANLSAYHPDLHAVQPLSQSFNWNDAVYRNTRPVYDMESYMQLIGQNHPVLLAAWQQAFDNCILYKASTHRDFTGIVVKNYGGLGSFIIKKPEEINYRGYDRTAWWTDVVSIAPIYN